MAAMRVPIRPQVGVFSVFEAVDYKAWYALAEFVDNALQSVLDGWAVGSLKDLHGVLHVEIESTAGSDGSILIRDNAGGIALDRFQTAFQVGSPPPDTSGLSVYGIGMKSAAAWFAQRVRITTTVAGDPILRTVEYDFPGIVEGGIQELEVTEQPTLQATHGTEILLTGLRNPINTKTHGKVRDHLTSIYRNYIRAGQLALTYQGDTLAYHDPEILIAPLYKDKVGPDIHWLKDIDVELSTGERIHGFAAIRKVGRVAGSGFSLYRNDRVITGLEDDPWRPVEIFGYGNSYRSQRVFGELHLENVKVAYSKNGFVWQASEEEMIERLREAIDSEPKPLLRQAEGYRSRETEPRQRQAIQRAFDAAAPAVEKSVREDVPNQAVRTPASMPDRSSAPTVQEELGSQVPAPLRQRTFTTTLRGQTWEITMAITESHDEDWISIIDEPSGATDRPRRLGVSISISNEFMRQFGGRDASETEPVLRVAAAIALAVAIGREQGIQNAHFLLRQVNQLIAGSLGRR